MSSNGSFWRAVLRPVAVLSIASVVAAGLPALPVVAPAPAAAAPAAGAPKSARTAAEASRLAARFKTSVEVEEKTSEYVRTEATPDGKLKAELSNSPVRVKRGAGWVAIDRTLAARSDGTIGPKAASADVAFSGGGTGTLARFAQDGGIFELKSPWTLPKPTLEGSKATYAAVLPGVDLVVESTVDGFSYNLVVQTRAAAANPALRSLTFPVTTSQLALRNTPSGRAAYVDPGGREVLSIGEALMWDSAGRTPTGPQAKLSSAAAVGDGPSNRARRSMMAFGGSRDGLTVKPDQAMLTNPATVFPVVIDPTMVRTPSRNAWTAAWEYYPTKSFWKTTHSLGVGYEGFEQFKIVRSFFQFDVAAFAGKKIVDASLRTYETHSASCTSRQVMVSRTAPITAATTWNNQPSWQGDVAHWDGAKGYNSSCPAGHVDFDVTNSVQYTSSAYGKIATFRLRATTENDKLGWKQFDSTGLLTISYVAYPLAAYDLGVSSVSDNAEDCAPSSDPSIVTSLRPQVSARGRLAAGDNQSLVYTQIQIVNPATGGVWTMTSGLGKPGDLKRLQPTADLGGNILYRYHARTLNSYPGGQLVSPWSGDCYFKIDTLAPPAPTITASYNGKSLTNCLTSPDPDSCPHSVPFGARVTWTISSATTDVVALSYGFDGKLTRVNGRSYTVGLDTPKQGWITLGATAHDGASHTSPTRYFRINVGPGLPPVGSWNFDETSGTTAADSSGQGHPLTVTGASFDDAGRVGGSLVFNGIGDHATATAPVVDTSRSFTLSAWARPTSFQEGSVVGVFGSQGFGGQLYYSEGANRWVFMQGSSDAASAPQVRVQSDLPATWGVWTHLVGVFDVNAKTMTLYVNGKAQATQPFTHTPWKATGPLEVGWYRFSGTHGGSFAGSVDDVKVWPRTLTAGEVKLAADPRVGPSASDVPVAALSARYPFEYVYSGTDNVWRTPEAVYEASMNVSGFGPSPAETTAIVEDPERGNVLSAKGSSTEVVKLGRPLVDATGSFTVTVWVKLSDTSKPRVIARQAGTTKDSWRLEYRPTSGDGAVWAFSRASSDSTTATVTEVTQPTSLTTADEWTALVGYYDSFNGKIGIKLGDRSGDGGTTLFSSPFQNGATVVSGPPSAGTSLPFAGLMDELRIYAGVVPQQQLCDELGDPTMCS